MVKYEYKQMETEYKPGSNELTNLLNSLGGEKWELITITPLAHSFILIFIRRKMHVLEDN